MKVIEIIKKPKYLLLAILASIIMAVVYIYLQVLGVVHNIDLWFSVIPWYNAILFIVFAILFGITLSFQIYIWKQPKVCAVGKKVKGVGTSSSATALGFLVAQCPACASLGALFLPVSVMGFLTKFSYIINLISIGLLLFVINYLGGFKKDSA